MFTHMETNQSQFCFQAASTSPAQNLSVSLSVSCRAGCIQLLLKQIQRLVFPEGSSRTRCAPPLPLVLVLALWGCTQRRDPCLFPTCYGPVALRGRWQFGKPGNELVSLSPRTPTGWINTASVHHHSGRSNFNYIAEPYRASYPFSTRQEQSLGV